MSIYQFRGVTGIPTKKDELAETYERSALLPYEKSLQYSRAADDRANELRSQELEQNQDYYNKQLGQEKSYYTQMAGIQDDAQKAAERDRNRGLWIQGGMAGVAGLNALNDAVGGDLGGKAVSAVKDIFSPAKEVAFSRPGDMMSRYVGDYPSAGKSPVSGIGGTLGTAGTAAKDYLIDPLVSGAKKIYDVGAGAVSGAVDFIGGLFS